MHETASANGRGCNLRQKMGRGGFAQAGRIDAPLPRKIAHPLGGVGARGETHGAHSAGGDHKNMVTQFKLN